MPGVGLTCFFGAWHFDDFLIDSLAQFVEIVEIENALFKVNCVCIYFYVSGSKGIPFLLG